MTLIHNCPVTPAHLDAWTPLLVSGVAPFFITEHLAQQLPADTQLITRDEFNRSDVALSYTDSYKVYAVHTDGAWVALLNPAAFDALPPTLQTALLLAQWELGRGQVYDLATVQPLLAERIDTPGVRSRTVETTAGPKLVLDAALWRSLPLDVQQRWLLQFVRNAQESYAIIAQDAVAWESIEPGRRANVQALANRFPLKSGTNCFATTLAAITADPETARIIGESWLHQGPFLRGLAARGYERNDDALESAHLHDAILLWFDEKGIGQHACYVLNGHVVLNKNSQQWYTPAHLVALPDLLACWRDDPFVVAAYLRRDA